MQKSSTSFWKPMCLLEDAEECNLQPFGSRRWRRKKGFSTASHLQHEQNTSLLCSSVHHKTNVNRKVLKITKHFWFKDALSSTLSFLLWILRKEKRIPHISPPRVRHFCGDCCFFVGAVKTASVKNILIDSADGSQPPVSEGPAYVGPRGWSGRSVRRADSFCRGCDVTTALVCIESTDAHWGAERLGRGRRGWFMSTFNMFQRSFLSTFVTVPPTPAAADCRAFKLDIIHLSLSLCVHEKRGSTKPELNRGPLRSKTPQTLNWAEDSVMQIFCDAEAKALMRSLQVFFLPVCVCVCVSSPEAKNRVGGGTEESGRRQMWPSVPSLHRACPDRSGIHAPNQYVQAVTGRLLTVEYLIMLRVEREEAPGEKIPQLLNFWTSRIMKNGTAWSHDILVK